MHTFFPPLVWGEFSQRDRWGRVGLTAVKIKAASVLPFQRHPDRLTGNVVLSTQKIPHAPCISSNHSMAIWHTCAVAALLLLCFWEQEELTSECMSHQRPQKDPREPTSPHPLSQRQETEAGAEK